MQLGELGQDKSRVSMGREARCPSCELGAVGALFSLYKLEESPLWGGHSAAL